MSTDVPFDAFEMDDVDADRPGSGGGGMLPEGGYRFMVTEVIVQNERGSTEIECEVLEAKDANLVGRKHKEFLGWPDKQHSETYDRIKKEQLLAWCYAAKTTSAAEIKLRQIAHQGFNVAWLEAMVGRQVLGFVKQEIYQDASGNDKTSVKCEGRVWSLDNPKGKGIPGWIPTAAPTGPGAAASTAPPLTNQPPAAANSFDGLV